MDRINNIDNTPHYSEDYNNLQSNYYKLQKNFKKLKSDYENLKAKKTELEEKIDKLNQEKNELKEKYQKLNNRNKALIKDLDNVEKDLENKNKKLKSLNDFLNNINPKYNAYINLLSLWDNIERSIDEDKNNEIEVDWNKYYSLLKERFSYDMNNFGFAFSDDFDNSDIFTPIYTYVSKPEIKKRAIIDSDGKVIDLGNVLIPASEIINE